MSQNHWYNFQRKRNYFMSMILQISVQGETRAVGSLLYHFKMSRK